MGGYMGEKEKKYQYCVRVKNGNNSGLNHYIWASESQIMGAMENNDVFTVLNRFKNKPGSLSMKYKHNSPGSLVIDVPDENLANFVVEELGLPQPFVKYNGEYILNIN